MSKSDNLRREYESIGRRYPGDRAAARRQLELARECTERAHVLDPSLKNMALDERSSQMALDAAAENAIIERAIRTARKSVAPRSTSRKVNSMRTPRGFNADSLFQRDPGSRDLGPAFSAAMAQRNKPRVSSRGHAFDAEPDHDAALEHLEHARNHIESVQAGSSEFDPGRLAGYFKGAMDCMRGGAEDEDDPRDDEPTAEERHRAATGEASVTEDDLGEVRPEATVTTRSARSNPDHRKDFNSAKQGGADAALADFDGASLFQKG